MGFIVALFDANECVGLSAGHTLFPFTSQRQQKVLFFYT